MIRAFIKESILEVLQKELLVNHPRIKPYDRLGEDCHLNELELNWLLNEVEQSYHVQIPDNTITLNHRLSDVVTVVKKAL
jgi:acyl carrier protein